jgi:hypothetical protein
MIFGTSNTERLRIQTNGNVGIGTTLTTSTLHLHSTSASTEIKIALTDASTTSSSNDGIALLKNSQQDGYLWNFENKSLIFGTNSIERLRIDNTGNVGIGTNNPNPEYKLDVNGDVNISSGLNFVTNINNVTSNELYYLQGVTSPIQTQFANASNFTNNVRLSLGYRFDTLTTDNIIQGTTNKFITNNTYDGDFNITGKLTVSYIDITDLGITYDNNGSSTNTDILSYINTVASNLNYEPKIYLGFDQYVLQNNENGKVALSSTPVTKLTYLNNVTTDIQEQFTTVDNRITNLTPDQFANGTSNRYIYNGLVSTNLHILSNIVGIGTNSATCNLHIHTSTTNNNNASVGIRLTNTDTGTQGTNGLSLHSFRSDGYLWNYYNSNLIFGTSNTERVRIDRSGNVGIGITNPQTNLHVAGKTYIDTYAVGIPANGIYGGNNGTRLILWPGSVSTTPFAFGIDNSTLWYGVPSGSSHKWYSANTNNMTLDSSGNLSITGTMTINNSAAALYVGTSSGTGTIFMGGGHTGDSGYDHSVIETRPYDA